MTAITTRLIVVAEGQPDPLAADNPQLLFVHSRAGINIDPVLVNNSAWPLDFVPDLWDMLVGIRFDKEGFDIVYEAEMQAEGGEIVVKTDLLEDYGLRDYPHQWGGWPTPGDGEKRPEVDPESHKLTKAQQEAADRISKKRKDVDDTKTVHVRGKVETRDAAPKKR